MLNLVAVLDLIDEDLRRFETRYEMFVDNDGSIARNVTCNLLLPLLVDETAKAPDVDILAARHVLFHNGKECFHGCRYIRFVDAGLFCNLVNYICLRHGGG